MAGKAAILVLDGWGLNPDREWNAVAQGDTPFTRSLFARFPHTRIETCGRAVGLPGGQMGNSEVGHQNMGAGRIVYQDLTRIDKAIEDGELARNPELVSFFADVRGGSGRIHLLGLVSDGGVHSHQRHAVALAEAAVKAGIREIYLHAFTDGRDTPPKEAVHHLAWMAGELERIGRSRIATVGGRYYGMDRDKRWDRVAKAYDAMVRGQGPRASDPVALVGERYAAGETDEFLVPTVIEGPGDGRIGPRDGILMFNFRADRARQLARCLLRKGVDAFPLEPLHGPFLAMTRYEEGLDDHVLFPPQSIRETLPELVSVRGGRQLRAAETEKYAHVTFFFSCGREEPFPGEDRLLVPSPKVATYDLKPEMSAPELTDQVIARIRDQPFDLVVLNYANCDMVGHTGKWDAALTAVASVDRCLAKVVPALMDRGFTVFLTADHGNIEKMRDEATGEAFTEHTLFPVPLLVTDPGLRFRPEAGKLADLAPTVMAAVGWEPGAQMDGASLLADPA